jgi:hypothetical protein
MRGLSLFLLAALALEPVALAAEGSVGGYMRVMTRPDFQGGDGRLGYWNLYGRLLNEGPFVALESQLALLEREPGSDAVWTRVHGRIEGGSVGNSDAGNGSLENMRLTQLYAQAGNILIPEVTWQFGTLQTWMGDLGLYDMRPSTLFDDTVGVSAHYQQDAIDLLVGLGDAGYAKKGERYNTVFSAGANLRVRPVRGLELGFGSQFWFEPEVVGNRYAPYSTPDLDYEDWTRGEVLSTWVLDHPDQEQNFPDPEPTAASSYKLVGYLGFGGLGPLEWNSLFVSYQRLHPEIYATETYNGDVFELYIHDLTDERTALLIGDELQLSLVPERLDMVLGGLYGAHGDADNSIAPSEHNRSYASTVLRLQTYATPVVHFLVETSYAVESSTNGNQYRNSVDSVFENTDGVTDSRGLEYGDSDSRTTWQGKGGLVLNPLGPGIYVRPSMRLLYGVQWSSQNAAFGNSFVETLDQYNDFGNIERHLHHVVALETEVWF